MPDTPPRPTDAELEILTVLWSLGPATVREVHDVISRRRTAQYSTILKFMQIMAEKGLVRRNEEQRAHVYEAARPHMDTAATGWRFVAAGVWRVGAEFADGCALGAESVEE